jgi:thiamine biosynthesis lipoprotein
VKEERSPLPVRTEAAMGTIVTIQVVRSRGAARAPVNHAIERAFGWFYEIEERCSRFNRQSELMQLTEQLMAQPGVPVAVSAILFEAVHFALLVAEESGGAFDPVVGHRMQARGFNREYGTGAIVDAHPHDDDVTYRDVVLDSDRKTILLLRPLTLDLGGVAKGLAVDLAARELEPFENFAIDAGGDLYLGGRNERGDPWTVGVRHPRNDRELIASLHVSNQAVCTSGDYERRTPQPGGSHILDPRTGESSDRVASATVVASGAMLADALSTAAFVLGPAAALQFLDRMGVEGLIVTPQLERFETQGLRYAA